jgi:2-desacetyl-2-hydroxyethyl bacteriochlorophyllide A dehydrogenase
MKSDSIIWTAAGTVSFQSTDVPEPGPGQVLVDVAYSVVSPGTEREWLDSDQSHVVLGTTFPFVPGYSLAGTVRSVGAEVRRFRRGDRVVGSPLFGAHASLALVADELTFHVPDDVSLRQAVYFNLGRSAAHTLWVSGVRLGDSMTIVGQGPIGTLATQIAASYGAHPIVAVELDETRRARALAAGATYALDPADPDFGEFVESTGGTQYSVDLSGSLNGLATAIQATAPLGTVVLSTGINADLTIPYGQVFLKGLTLKGAFVNARAERAATDIDAFLALVEREMIGVPDDPDDRFSPEQAAEIYSRVLRGDRTLTAPVFDWTAYAT